ncbi:hypothetical protein F511_35291 [Dorcoceras hygrometricum]|uniref:Uncharacterized protein n=1 Tax=Dorcoceras hygrometricum TaxID=472368 RepID=A0A2Z7BWA2_9LAMI|nr:hypothetical protein F511_35291 [Dorcoceras hygrometricum]
MGRVGEGGAALKMEARVCTCVTLNGSGIQLAVGPTTIVTPKSQFRTCPSDHGKAPSNIAP